METYVDPAVSRAKFEREIALYRQIEDAHLRRGWWLLKASYPEVFVVFACQRTKPTAIIFGALLDFTDYDFRPPSVRLVHPLTRVPYKFKELPTVFKRTVLAPNPPELAAQGLMSVTEQILMVAHHEDDIPFFCIPGVREYHAHPGHSGDIWELHRNTGVGTLNFLLTQMSKYGVEPVTGFNVAMNVVVTGFQQTSPPQ